MELAELVAAKDKTAVPVEVHLGMMACIVVEAIAIVRLEDVVVGLEVQTVLDSLVEGDRIVESEGIPKEHEIAAQQHRQEHREAVQV